MIFRFIFIVMLLAVSMPAYALELRGQIMQGGLVTGRVVHGASVFLEGREIALTPDGYFVFGFGRDHAKQAVLEIRYPDGRIEKKELDVKQREYKIQRIDNLDSKMVSPPEGTWERIASDRTLVANARIHKTREPYFLRGFIPPAEGVVSGVYGSQRILNGKPKQPHYGIDYAAPEGAPVIAPAAGIVRLGHKDMYYTGGTVIIDHGYGVSSTLMHMSAVHVTEGQEVDQGGLIGAVGSTGRATGPHLDWRMNWRDQRIDPALVLPEEKLTE